MIATTSRTARVVRTIRTGSSGSVVRIVQHADGRYIAVKTTVNPRVAAVAQATARASVAPLFGDRLPRVLFAGQRQGRDLLIMECPSVHTLADMVVGQGHTPTAAAIWQDVVHTLVGVWKESARPGYTPGQATRNHRLRVHRGEQGLDHAASRLNCSIRSPRHIVVNGIDHGTWQRVHDQLLALPAPIVHVACQGDPQPANILVAPDDRWHLIDWEWSGLHHDWRMMISHLLGWWYSQDILAHTRGHLTARHDTLDLVYTPPDIPAAPWVTPALEAFHAMSTASRWHDDLRALGRHLALLMIREIPRLTPLTSNGPAAVLLGEAIRLTNPHPHTDHHPLIRLLEPQ